MSKKLFPHKILWLASYPKSGNTWFRAFLSALLNEGKVEINNLLTDGIFASRFVFDLNTDIDSRDLYHEEAKMMLADVYRKVAADRANLSIIKVHDLFGRDAGGNYIVPGDVTLCAIYFIRNPLDIAGSLANHNHSSIEDAVRMLNNPDAYLARQRGNFNKDEQFPQYLSDWSSHVKSWTQLPSFPVHTVRYEDMITNSFETFSKLVRAIGWDYTGEQIENAITASSFEQLSKQEAEKGFAEKFAGSARFFRSGTIKNWHRELKQEWIQAIIKHHGETMRGYNYLNQE